MSVRQQPRFALYMHDKHPLGCEQEMAATRLGSAIVLAAMILALTACNTPTPLPAPTATPGPTAAARVTAVPFPTSAATQRALAANLADVQADLAALNRLLQDAQTSGTLDRAAVQQTVARLEASADSLDAFLYPESMGALQAPFHELAAGLRAADGRALEILTGQTAAKPADLAALYQPVSATLQTAGVALADLSHTPAAPIAQPSVQATPAP